MSASEHPAPAGDELRAEPGAPDPTGTAATAKKSLSWWDEIKSIFWLLLAVLAFHSFIAKPFYIPSGSMMPTLLKGDRLVVTKFPYGWSWVSPSFHLLSPIGGRLFGRMPERGDIVIATPPGRKEDWIKRVVGLPGDTVEMRSGQLILNGTPVKREMRERTMIPLDPNIRCGEGDFSWGTDMALAQFIERGPDGKGYCRLPVFRETLPNGRSYDTIDLGYFASVDTMAPVTVPAGHVFLMGDNRDESADSRVDAARGGLGGAVPWENLGGRAEFTTFSLDGSSSYWNPISWFTALRGGRAGLSLHPAESSR